MIILPDRIQMDHRTLAIGKLNPPLLPPRLTRYCRRRSQSPPPRSSSSAYDPSYGGAPYSGGGPPAGYTGGNGYPGNNHPPRNTGGARDYPPRTSRDNAEPPPGYRRL